MDNQTQQDDLFDVEVDSISKKTHQRNGSMAKIVAISAFISYGLSLVIAIFGNRERRRRVLWHLHQGILFSRCFNYSNNWCDYKYLSFLIFQ
jgi:hypothetical protein